MQRKWAIFVAPLELFAKTRNVCLDSGDIRSFSRFFAQTYLAEADKNRPSVKVLQLVYLQVLQQVSRVLLQDRCEICPRMRFLRRTLITRYKGNRWFWDVTLKIGWKLDSTVALTVALSGYSASRKLLCVADATPSFANWETLRAVALFTTRWLFLEVT